MPEQITIEHAGETLVLDGAPGAYWPNRSAVIVADVHLGKAAAFRAGGVPVPESTTAHDLARLTALVERHAAGCLIVLGDLVHAKAWLNDATRLEVERWRNRHSDLAIRCIRGNHDRNAGALPESLRIEELAEPSIEGPFELLHDPEEAGEIPSMAGHLHPCVRLRTTGAGSGLRARCFWKRSGCLVFPAFGSFTGGLRIEPGPEDEIWATRDGVVVPIEVAASS